MKRTQIRLIVRGIIAPDDALFFDLIIAVFNTLVSFLLLNSLFILYLIYTIWLKYRSI